MLAVMAIISLIMAMLIGASRFARIKAMEGQAKADLQHIANALNEYKLQNYVYPPTILIAAITNKLPANVDVIDPWERQYVYTTSSSNQGYRLYSQGRNPPAQDPSGSDDIVSGK